MPDTYIFVFWRACFALLEWLLLTRCLLTSSESFFHVYLICRLVWWWFDFWSELSRNVLPYETFSEWKEGVSRMQTASALERKRAYQYILWLHTQFQQSLCFPRIPGVSHGVFWPFMKLAGWEKAPLLSQALYQVPCAVPRFPVIAVFVQFYIAARERNGNVRLWNYGYDLWYLGLTTVRGLMFNLLLHRDSISS